MYGIVIKAKPAAKVGRAINIKNMLPALELGLLLTI